MHIVIPMAGVGNRFIKAGYKEPKPLIKINGKTIVGHACDIFPNETKFTFICNAKHLADTNMREELLKIQPNANVIEIPNHTEGPVYTVLQILDLIEDDEEIIINYCDFGIYWDYEDFLKHTRDRDADGAVVSYNKFHPHMFSGTNYAISTDTKQWMLEIKEKEPIDDAMEKYVSNGTYYFKKGSILKKYFKELIDEKITYNDEYYVSLVYNLLVKDNLKVSIYNIHHMLQWGVPEEVEDYNYWSDYFSSLTKEPKAFLSKSNSTTVISLLDENIDFEKVAYKEYTHEKPFLDISGKPMIIQVLNSMPSSEQNIFLLSEEHLKNENLVELLKEEYPTATISSDKKLSFLDENVSILFSSYDKSIIYDKDKYVSLINNDAMDIIVFTSNGQPFGTVYSRNLKIFNSISSKLNDSKLIEILKNEYDYRVEVLEVSNLIAWDSPYNYETYCYWQSFFHKVEWHPYSLEKDSFVNQSQIKALDKKFRSFEQEFR